MNLVPNSLKTHFASYSAKAVMGCICGLVAGICAHLFIESLRLATLFCTNYPWAIWLLPMAGLFIGWIYSTRSNAPDLSHSLIIDEIHDPKENLPLASAPKLYLSTVLTHLFGGSAGREGVIVQTATTICDALFKKLNFKELNRQHTLVCAASAGFSAAIGAPWAGFLFGYEMLHIGKIKFFSIFQTAIASVIAYKMTQILGTSHSVYPQFSNKDFNFVYLLCSAIGGIGFGMMARFFCSTTHYFEQKSKLVIPSGPWRAFFAGLVLATVFSISEFKMYSGLGTEYILQSMNEIQKFWTPFFKSILTTLTIGSGFKGGEFVPLVYIGSTLGSAFSAWLPAPTLLLSAIGSVALFAGASNTPLTCTLMAIELFGWPIAPYALIACYMSYYFSGQRGIYKSQKNIHPKWIK